MTASNLPPADLSVATTLSLLERLTAATQMHAKAGEALLKESRVRRLTLERRQGEVSTALDQQQAKEGGELDQHWLGLWEATDRSAGGRLLAVMLDFFQHPIQLRHGIAA